MIVGGIDGELIGRLSATAEAVAEGTCGATLVVLVGRSGVGKTTIVQRFHQDLIGHSAGAAGWSPIRTGSAPWLESRRWVHPRGPAVRGTPLDGVSPLSASAHGGSARVSPPGATSRRNAASPWLWLGVECGPDAVGAVDALALARERAGALLCDHAPSPVLAVADRPAGDGSAPAPAPAVATSALTRDLPSAPGLPADEVDLQFVELARRHPTIVAVDDLHLADSSMTAWLRRLLTGAPVLVVGTAWPQPIEQGPLGVMADPLSGVHVEMVEVDLLDPPSMELLVREVAADLEGRDVSALLERGNRNPLELQVLLDTLSVRGAREMGVAIDRTMVELLPGGSHDELEPMWRSLPPRVREALGTAAELGAGWLALSIGSITQSAAEAVLAEIAGDRPAQTWVAELDEHLAVWIDPVLQAVAAHRNRPPLPVDDLLELHRWVVASALDMARRWVPDDRAAVEDRRAALAAEGFLPTMPPPSSPPARRGPATPAERAVEVDRLLHDLRTGDPSRIERIAGEIDSLLEICRREDGPVAATTMRLEIARSAIARRRSDAARALERLRPLMALALDLHGTDGMPVLEGRWNGVLLLRRVRRRGDAVREADCLVRTLIRTHGPQHPDTESARGLLAETLGAAGLHAESLQLFSQMAVDVARRNGPGSAEALATYLCWSDALYLAGRRSDAVVLMRQVEGTAVAALPPGHPLRDRMRRHLARLEEGRVGNPRRAERRFGRSTVPAGR